MPRNILKSIGRRRSSGNALDIPDTPSPTPESSFRVIERPQKNFQHTFNAPDDRSSTALGTPRAFNSPLAALRGKGKSADDLTKLGANRWVKDPSPRDQERALNSVRGSGGTTNSGSSGYYESSSVSARHSSTSTLPSSLDPDAERDPDDEDLFARKATAKPMHRGVSPRSDDPLPPPPSFSSRAARAFSFGSKQNKPDFASKTLPAPPTTSHVPPRSPERTQSPARERALTTSSYASTTVPAKAEPNLSLGLAESSFGDDFGNMFGNLGAKVPTPKRSEESFPVPSGGFHRTASGTKPPQTTPAHTQQESEPMYPARALSRNAFRSTPSPHLTRQDSDSPYSWDSRNSNDGLVSSALSSPELDGPAVPAHGNGITPAFLAGSKGAYSQVPDRYESPGLERSSYDSDLGVQEQERKEVRPGFSNAPLRSNNENRWVNGGPSRPQVTSAPRAESSRPVVPASSTAGPSRSTLLQTQATVGAARNVFKEEEDTVWSSDSMSTTPRAGNLTINESKHGTSLFDSSPAGPPSRAVRPLHKRTESGTQKKMTKAQFDYLQRRGDVSHGHSEDEAHQDDEYDDEDDAERAKQLSKQRRKQEATMAVYRQQMKKVTGGGPTDLPSSSMRPSLDRSSRSAPAGSALHLGGIGGTPPPETLRGKQITEEDDDEVPLGILQAHGFPSVNRPPTGLGDHQRAPSMAASVGGNLPAFARRLPADPYFGAGIAHQSNRESLAFGGGGSVYGGSSAGTPQGNHPGGLVGVIASEERAKAARRGSPNPVTGAYNPGQPMPSMSVGAAGTPQAYMQFGMPTMPGMQMPQMPIMGQDPASQQMQQFMTMQMQMMQNMMAMQQSLGQSPQPMQQATDYLGVPMGGQRPTSVASNGTGFGMAPNPGRAMTMTSPPSRWDFAQGLQRPASQMPPSNYAPSIQGLNAGPGPDYTPSIAPSERSNVGLPSRYRPVTQGGDGRTQSMTSSLTLQALAGPPAAPNPEQASKSTIRIIDKPKGTPKITSKPLGADEDEDEGWAEMAKKRSEKKFGWRRKEKENKEPALSELYNNFD